VPAKGSTLADWRLGLLWRQSGASAVVAVAVAETEAPVTPKSAGKSRGHASFDSKVTPESVASAFAKSDAEGSVVSGRSGGKSSVKSARGSRCTSKAK
jgi:hypothetical protein